MKDRELITFVREFRDGLLGKHTSDRRCGMVCWPLVTLLNMENVECDLEEGTVRVVHDGENFRINHIWIRLRDGRILDPTADQFNRFFLERKYPPVYLGPPRIIHKYIDKKSKFG